MKNIFTKNKYVSFFILIVLTFANSNVYAQKRVLSVTQKNAKQFEKISTFFEQKKDNQAKALLDKLNAKPGLNNFEKAYVAHFLGAYYFERDQLDKALIEYTKIINNQEGVTQGFINQSYYTIAQVYFSKEDYNNALKFSKKWFETEDNPSGDAYMLVGQAYYALEQYDNALPNIKKAIDKFVAAGSKKKESWLNLLSSIYREQKDYKNMISVVNQLIDLYPKKSYLMALGGIYNELGDQKKMLAVYQTSYDMGLMSSEAEKLTLVSLLIDHGNPYKASTILGDSINDGSIAKNQKNYRLYSQTLVLAKEYKKSIAPLAQAAKLSDNGELYVHLGQTFMTLNEWQEAESAFNQAIQKGKLLNKGKTIINLGISQLEQKKYDDAKKSFKQARKNEQSASLAASYLKYVESEIRRINELKKPIAVNFDGNI